MSISNPSNVWSLVSPQGGEVWQVVVLLLDFLLVVQLGV